MKRLLILFSSAIFIAAWLPAQAEDSAAVNLDSLLQQVKEGQQSSAKINRERESRFIKDRKNQATLLKEAEAKVAELTARSTELREVWRANQEKITERKQSLSETIGELRQIHALVRQGANDLATDLEKSLVSAQHSGRSEQLKALAQDAETPGINEIRQLWFLHQQEMTEGGKVTRFSVPVIAADGREFITTVIRNGLFSATAEGKLLQYLPEAGQLQIAGANRQQQGVLEEQAQAQRGLAVTIIDPTKGGILALLDETPDLGERIHQGGVVGYIIIGIGIFGGILAAIQFAYLLVAGWRIERQRAQIATPNSNNALGRVLAAAHESGNSDLESLELKLDEAILKEAPRLERVLPLIKLCAAVAPLMGLLGTVTGMILTFQAITLFGTGDPKLMAGGISQALVTTVLGLCVAIPLLFVHGFVGARSRKLLQILDEQSAGLLARQIESKVKA